MLSVIAQMEQLDSLVEVLNTREDSKFALTECGEQFVHTTIITIIIIFVIIILLNCQG